jgi:Ran GTPase-activating protein (RanGAP) involved in mRNA processing and transport
MQPDQPTKPTEQPRDASSQLTIACPISGPKPFVPCKIDEVMPIAEFLRSGVVLNELRSFPRGTIMPDGRLDLCKQSLGPEGCSQIVKALENNRTVKSLMLGTDGIGDQGAKELAQLVATNDSLEVLYLGCNGITDEGVRSLSHGLASNSTIQGLWLKRNPIGPAGCRHVASLLKTNRSIRVLDLVHTGIDLDALQELCEVLADPACNVSRLYLGGNQFGAQHARHLSVLMERQPRLNVLMLNVNQLGDDGCIEIAEGLFKNQTLNELGLASNGIHAPGMIRLTESLLGHPAIARLDLGFSASTQVLGAMPNCFEDTVAELFCQYLKSTSRLRFLDLCRCGLSDAATVSLENAIQSNGSLTEVRLGKPLSSETMKRLQANAELLPHESVPDEVSLIKSVYRTRQRS